MKDRMKERMKELAGINEGFTQEIATQSQKLELEKYVRAIKNKNKQKYAQEYLKDRLRGGDGEEVQYSDLSYMGAQAVRMSIEDILFPKGVTE